MEETTDSLVAGLLYVVVNKQSREILILRFAKQLGDRSRFYDCWNKELLIRITDHEITPL